MRVVVVDDQELMRRGLTLLLGTSREVEVVGEAADGHEALAVVNARRPDVVLTDARMPGLDGVGLIRALAEQSPGLPVIMLTTFDDGDLVHSALDAGAAGFLLKDASTDDLVQAVRSVVQGGVVLDPRVARAALRGGPGVAAVEAESPLSVLSPAEMLVARQVATGATNAEIAATLVIAEGTVKNHVSALLRKLGQRDRTALALLLSRSLGPAGG